MSFHSWIYILALGLSISMAGHAWSQSTTENEPRQEEGGPDVNGVVQSRDRQSSEFSSALEGIESAIRSLAADPDRIAADAQSNRESRDLEAQEGMAHWAEWMFYATGATVALTFAALLAIIRTLHHTRRAADYTKDMLVEANRSAVAAEGAVAATRDIGEKQVRAYLHVKNVSFCIGKNDGEVGATISVANAGQSPAIGVKATIVFENDGKEPVIFNMPMPNIAANSEQTRTNKPIKQATTGRGLAGANRVTTYVTVEAMDVFNQEIEAVSMRTIYIDSGAKAGEDYKPEDAEGYFPDEAVKLLAAGYGRFGPNKKKSGPDKS